MPRWNPKVDANQKDIVTKLRQCGISVLHLHGVGKNAPDLCCGYRGVTTLLEVKSTKKQTMGKTPKAIREAAQITWCETWQGPAAVVRSFDEALAFVKQSAGQL